MMREKDTWAAVIRAGSPCMECGQDVGADAVDVVVDGEHRGIADRGCYMVATARARRSNP